MIFFQSSLLKQEVETAGTFRHGFLNFLTELFF